MNFKLQDVTSLRRTALFGLALASAPLSGLVDEATSSPVNFIPALRSGWIMPIVV